ncbi:hypothetical protein ACE6H2_010052 [Prunus campanulata]
MFLGRETTQSLQALVEAIRRTPGVHHETSTKVQYSASEEVFQARGGTSLHLNRYASACRAHST